MAAASCRSARRTSGRRRSRSDGSPTGTSGGTGGIGDSLDNSSTSACGPSPSSTANWCIDCRSDARSAGIVAAVASTSARARATSSCVVKPLLNRSIVSPSVSRWLWRFCLGDGDLPLGAAEGDVVARHLRQQADQRVAAVLDAGGQVRPGGFDVALHAAEHVHLPGGVEADLVDVGGDAGRPPAPSGLVTKGWGVLLPTAAAPAPPVRAGGLAASSRRGRLPPPAPLEPPKPNAPRGIVTFLLPRAFW